MRPGVKELLTSPLTAGRACSRARPSDDSENLVLAHNQELFTVDLDFRTAVLAEQDAVAHIHIQRLARSVFPVFALADGDHFALLRFLFGRVRDDDAAANLLTFLDALHDNAVM